MIRNIFVAALISLILGACASNPDKIAAAYVSPFKYKDFTCDQLDQEIDYVGRQTTKLYQRLKTERKKDNWQMGVGLVLFWPTLFALEGGDGPDAAEYAQLKGDFEALRQATVRRECSMDPRLSPEEIMKRRAEEDAEMDKAKKD